MIVKKHAPGQAANLACLLGSAVSMPTPYVYDSYFLVRSGKRVKVVDNGYLAWPWPAMNTQVVHTWQVARELGRAFPCSQTLRVRYLVPGSEDTMGYAGASLPPEELWVPEAYLDRPALNLPGVPAVLWLERRAGQSPNLVRPVAVRGLDRLEIERAWITQAPIVPVTRSYSERYFVQSFGPGMVRLVTGDEAREMAGRHPSEVVAWWKTRPLLAEVLDELRAQGAGDPENWRRQAAG